MAPWRSYCTTLASTRCSVVHLFQFHTYLHGCVRRLCVSDARSRLTVLPCADNKMVWGAFWAVLHMLPLRRPHWLLRSVCYGLIASTVHCAVVFPAQVCGCVGCVGRPWCPHLSPTVSVLAATGRRYVCEQVRCGVGCADVTLANMTTCRRQLRQVHADHCVHHGCGVGAELRRVVSHYCQPL